MNVFTIGVYGLTEDEYFDKLLKAKIDTFCDIRRRRAVRGAKYVFVNSKRLQSKLGELGIKYVYIKELAPSNETRNKQKEADKKSGEQKRTRTELSNEFIEAYRKECIEKFDVNNFIKGLGSDVRNIVLFCVESSPEACHRSIVAEHLKKKLQDINIKHL